jgi:hypothetical protein
MATDKQNPVVERTPQEWLLLVAFEDANESDHFTAAHYTWESDRAELARLRAQVAERDADLAALVPLAKFADKTIALMESGSECVLASCDSAFFYELLGFAGSTPRVLDERYNHYPSQRAALARVEARNA